MFSRACGAMLASLLGVTLPASATAQESERLLRDPLVFADSEWSQELSVGGHRLNAARLPFLFTIDVHFEGGGAGNYNRCLAVRVRPGPRLALLTAAHCLMSSDDVRRPIHRITLHRTRAGYVNMSARREEFHVILPRDVCARRDATTGLMSRAEFMVVPNPLPFEIDDDAMLARLMRELGERGMPADIAIVVSSAVTSELVTEGFSTWSDVLGRGAIAVRRFATTEEDSVQDGDSAPELRGHQKGLGVGFNCLGRWRADLDECQVDVNQSAADVRCDPECVENVNPHVGARSVHQLSNFLAALASDESVGDALRARNGDSGGPLLTFKIWPTAYRYSDVLSGRPTVTGILSRVIPAHNTPHQIYTSGPVLERMQCLAWRHLEGVSAPFCLTNNLFTVGGMVPQVQRSRFDAVVSCDPGNGAGDS